MPANQPLTSVTGTVTTGWAGGAYAVTFSGQQGTKYSQNGQTFTTSYTGTLGATGNLAVSLPDNSSISPRPSAWRFHICSTTGPCFDTQVAISGTAQDISAQLQAAAPSLTTVVANPVPGSASVKGSFGPGQPGLVVVGNATQEAPLAVFTDSTGKLGVAITKSGLVLPDGTQQGFGGGNQIAQTGLTGSSTYTFTLLATAPVGQYSVTAAATETTAGGSGNMTIAVGWTQLGSARTLTIGPSTATGAAAAMTQGNGLIGHDDATQNITVTLTTNNATATFNLYAFLERLL